MSCLRFATAAAVRLTKIRINRPAFPASLFLVALTFFLVAAPPAAQAQVTDSDETISVTSSLVQLNVGVADRASGRSVLNLSPGDFAVYENDVRQQIVSFEPAEKPFSLVMLLDVSGSTLGFRSNLKQAAMRFIDALNPADRVAVISFNERVNTLSTFTADREKIGFAINRADGRGGTELYGALAHALKILSGEGQRRKAIIVLTDGIDTSQRVQDRGSIGDARTNEEALAAFKPEASPLLASVLDAADKQGVTIYPLALPSGDPKRLPYVSPAQVAIYNGARVRLQTLADRTGGRLSEIRRLEDMARLYVEVAADLRTLYSIAYQPSAGGAGNGQARDGRWRSIRIEVGRPDLIARTRPGYFAR